MALLPPCRPRRQSHILLSFAQFERELIGERVRDKVAASKKKGMWMGGTVPLGYDVKDRKLIVNNVEARSHVSHSANDRGRRRARGDGRLRRPRTGAAIAGLEIVHGQ